jgi:hypothetical protein
MIRPLSAGDKAIAERDVDTGKVDNSAPNTDVVSRI